MAVRVLQGDCRKRLAKLPAASLDACVCDPPYHLTSKAGGSVGFMGATWDGRDVAYQVDTWAAVYRVLKPGAYLLAFGGTRTWHRMVCAIEDAGFEIRDCIRNEQGQGQDTYLGWLYGQGFPKSHNLTKAIDKLLGTPGTLGGPKTAAHAGWIERGTMRGPSAAEGWQRPWMQDPAKVENAARRYLAGSAEAAAWDGWGTALKPAWEPICVARKPLEGTVASNVLEHGCGGLNIDACRVPAPDGVPVFANRGDLLSQSLGAGLSGSNRTGGHDATTGRWPANVVHDGSPSVVAAFPSCAGAFAPVRGTEPSKPALNVYGEYRRTATHHHGDGRGSAARFFYTAKAGKAERAGSKHPTVKPLALMRYLVRLVTPPGGHVLDCFAGSGTTGEAAHLEGFDATLIELLPDHVADIRMRLARCTGVDAADYDVSPVDLIALNSRNITKPRKASRKRGGVNITPPIPLHNKRYVAKRGQHNAARSDA